MDDTRYMSPEEQRRARLKAQQENNRRALTGIGISTNTPPLVPPTMYRGPKPATTGELADVIDMQEWKRKRGKK